MVALIQMDLEKEGGSIVLLALSAKDVDSSTNIILAFANSFLPEEKFKAWWVGVVWAEFVTTSIIVVTTGKNKGRILE